MCSKNMPCEYGFFKKCSDDIEVKHVFNKDFYKRRPLTKDIAGFGKAFVASSKLMQKIYFMRHIFNMLFKKKFTAEDIEKEVSDPITFRDFLYSIYRTNYDKGWAGDMADKLYKWIQERLEFKRQNNKEGVKIVVG